MRPLNIELEAGEIHHFGGDVLKIKVRSSSEDLEIKTDNDTIPCRAGDLIVLPSMAKSFTLENKGGNSTAVELIVMSSSGADLESSAGAVEVVNLPVVPDNSFFSGKRTRVISQLNTLVTSFVGQTIRNPTNSELSLMVYFDGPLEFSLYAGQYSKFEAGCIEIPVGNVRASFLCRLPAGGKPVNISYFAAGLE
jgi:hypothetical protein